MNDKEFEILYGELKELRTEVKELREKIDNLKFKFAMVASVFGAASGKLATLLKFWS